MVFAGFGLATDAGISVILKLVPLTDKLLINGTAVFKGAPVWEYQDYMVWLLFLDQ